ncbi:MAG: pyridoxamine 5'-phosphate oxidase family protein [Alphaproteobacteria bacterium]
MYKLASLLLFAVLTQGCFAQGEKTMPQNLNQFLNTFFNHTKNAINGQVSVIIDGKPTVRTMKIWDIKENGDIILIANTSSPKWKALEENQNISICMVNYQNLAQAIVSGTAELIPASKDPILAQKYWKQTIDGVKEVYFLNAGLKEGTFNLSQLPDNYGIIRVHPTDWEAMDIATPYKKSEKFSYTNNNGTWTKTSKQLF